MAARCTIPRRAITRVGARIGERGDFVTSPQVSPAFAAAIAKRFREDAGDPTGPLDFVEAGAGEGRFLEDFAAALRERDPAVSERVRFTAIERSAAGRASLEKPRLPAAPRILESAEGLEEGSVTGWIFSNELYDALPVVRVVGTRLGAGRAARGYFGWRAFRLGARSRAARICRAPRALWRES